MPGAGLSWESSRKAPPDMLALKPYWGKPTVRNFRGGDGNVGIIEARLAPSLYPTFAIADGLGRGRARPRSGRPISLDPYTLRSQTCSDQDGSGREWQPSLISPSTSRIAGIG